MKYSSVWLVFLLVSSTPLFAQRCGRAEALQNYLGVEPKSEIAAANQNRQKQSLLPCVRSLKENALGRHDLRSRNPKQVRGREHRTIDSRQSIELRVRKP
jgi:hypothetical protein